MGLSRERKIFIAVFGLAGAALVIDRGFLAPSSAGAAEVKPRASAEPDPEQIQAESEALVSTGGVSGAIAKRLRSAVECNTDPALIRDAFVLPAAWLEAVEPEPEDQPGDDPVEGPEAAPEPGAPAIALSSVMPTRRGGIAVVTGANADGVVVTRTLQLGESFAGARLVSVSARSVVVEYLDRRFEIMLSD